MIATKSIEAPYRGAQKIVYEVTSSKNGKTLTCEMSCLCEQGKTTTTVDFGVAETVGIDDAFDKLADWMERTSKEIRDRKPAPRLIPIFQ